MDTKEVESLMFHPLYISHYGEMGGGFDYFSSDLPMPESYIDFAREDINDGTSKRVNINAVGNAKRALHLQVENLCDAFAWQRVKKKRSYPFGVRLEFIRECGIISPAILSRLNKTRNRVEHDYYIPTRDEAIDYIDIVELFVSATKDILNRFPSNIDFELFDDDDAKNCEFPLPHKIMVELKCRSGGVVVEFENTSGISKIVIDVEDPEYFTWVGSFIRQYRL